MQNIINDDLKTVSTLLTTYTHLTKNYPPSSTDFSLFEIKETGTGRIACIYFTYSDRAESLFILAKITIELSEYVQTAILKNTKFKVPQKQLLTSLLTINNIILECLTESIINDNKAISDHHSIGHYFDNTMSSINNAQLRPLKAEFSTSRCEATFLDQKFYANISWLTTAEIDHQITIESNQQARSDYLVKERKKSLHIFERYSRHNHFIKIEAQPNEKNVIENHLNYAELLIQLVLEKKWSAALRILQNLVQTRFPYQKRQIEHDREESKKIRFFPLRDYFKEACRAVSYIFQHDHIQRRYQQNKYSIHIEELRSLLDLFNEWKRNLIENNLVDASDNSFSNIQKQIEKYSMELDKQHEKNINFIAEYFKEAAAGPKNNTRSENQHKNHQKSEMFSLSPPTQPSTKVMTKNFAITDTSHESSGATAAIVQPPSSYDDGNTPWLSIGKGGKIRADPIVALQNISEALKQQDMKNVVESLRSIDLDDTYDHLKKDHETHDTLPASFLTPLILGYKQVIEMSRQINRCKELARNIEPFITLILHSNKLPDKPITSNFTAAARQFKDFDNKAQKSFLEISQHISTILDLNTRDIKADAQVTAINILFDSTESLIEALNIFSDGLIFVWNKRYEILKSKYPDQLKTEKSKKDISDIFEELKNNNTALKQQNKYFEHYKNKHKETIYLSADQSPTIITLLKHTELNQKITCELPVELPENEESIYTLLKKYGAIFDVAIHVNYFSSGNTQKIERTPENEQPQRQLTADRLIIANIRILIPSKEKQEIRNYFHQKIIDFIPKLKSKNDLNILIITGSRACNFQINHLWGKELLNKLLTEQEQNMPSGITYQKMMATLLTRDTDIAVSNPASLPTIKTKMAQALNEMIKDKDCPVSIQQDTVHPAEVDVRPIPSA